jgi:hypothetical protein
VGDFSFSPSPKLNPKLKKKEEESGHVEDPFENQLNGKDHCHFFAMGPSERLSPSDFPWISLHFEVLRKIKE